MALQQYSQLVIVDKNSKEFLTRTRGKFSLKLPAARLFRYPNHANYALRLLRTGQHAVEMGDRLLEVKRVEIVYSDSMAG